MATEAHRSVDTSEVPTRSKNNIPILIFELDLEVSVFYNEDKLTEGSIFR